MTDDLNHKTFFEIWRGRVRVLLPDFKSAIASLGIYGTAAATIAILATDPALTSFTNPALGAAVFSTLTSLTCNYISNAVERWRVARSDTDHITLLREIADELYNQQGDQQLQLVFQNLDLIGVCFYQAKKGVG